MTYDLREIANYSEAIASLTRVAFNVPPHWEDHQRTLGRYAQVFREHPRSRLALSNYALAVHKAASYLIWRRDSQGVPVASDRQEIIDQYLVLLIQGYKANYPQGGIKAPLSVLEPSDSHLSSNNSLLANAIALRKKTEAGVRKLEGTSNEPALNSFVRSPQFVALERYLRNTLADDNRSHSYFCGLLSFQEERKAHTLNQLITDLRSRSSMDEVKEFLAGFYKQKNQGISQDSGLTWDRSRYDILNTGQNITTRFFSAFGKQTTTINLIDDLARSIGVDPQLTEELNQRRSHRH